MDITVYLPDEIGVKAKEAGLKFSRILRDGVIAELDRMSAVQAALDGAVQSKELDLVTDDGRRYIGRLEAALIYEDANVGVFLATNEKVYAYDVHTQRLHEAHSGTLADDLRQWLPNDDDYINVMLQLGQVPVIKIGR